MTSAATPRALTVLAALLEARTGQQIASYRTWRIDTALAPLLRERGGGDLLEDELVAEERALAVHQRLDDAIAE